MATAPHIYIPVNHHGNEIQEHSWEKLSSAPVSPYESRTYFNTVSKKFMGWDGTAWVDLSQVITGALIIRGEITNAQTNPSFPGSPADGDMYFITTNPGTVGGLPVEVGDQLIKGTSSWFVVQRNLEAATESTAGFMKIVTQATANAGSNDTDAMTALKTATFLIANGYTRKAKILITSLTANTVTPVTHGLNLATALEYQAEAYQGGEVVGIKITPNTINTVNVWSSATLANVTIMFQG